MTVRVTFTRVFLAAVTLIGAWGAGVFTAQEAKSARVYMARLQAQDTQYTLSLAERDGALRRQQQVWDTQKAEIQQDAADQAMALTERIHGLRSMLAAHHVALAPDTASAREIELMRLVAKARQ